jgi:NhaA family Na+:H+ antiporter
MAFLCLALLSMTNVLKKIVQPIVKPFTDFVRREESSGVILLVVSALALVLANTDTGIARYFPAIWEHSLRFSIGDFALEKSLEHWINDGLMALFFLIVGLEIKREVLEGELSSVKKAALPMVSALGGMLVPALIFFVLNAGSPTAKGWGIPMATDIAFAMGVLAMLGHRVPLPLKVFLMALAIVDDLGAVVVIALFYTQQIQLTYLGLAAGVWVGLLLLNQLKVRALIIYLALGVVLWFFTLKSGVHATIAGVLLAIAIPFRTPYQPQQLVSLLEDRIRLFKEQIRLKAIHSRDISEELEAFQEKIGSPSQKLEQHLHGVVAFLIIPLFAFCNTSILIEPKMFAELGSVLGLGVILGLLLGKPLGICLFAWVSVRLGWADLPEGVNWRHLVGVGVLGGIGFTMSIFVTLLAFEGDPELQSLCKVAILVASLLSGSLGFVLLRRIK